MREKHNVQHHFHHHVEPGWMDGDVTPCVMSRTEAANHRVVVVVVVVEVNTCGSATAFAHATLLPRNGMKSNNQSLRRHGEKNGEKNVRQFGVNYLLPVTNRANLIVRKEFHDLKA